MLCMLPDSADEAPSVRSVAYVFQIGLALACIAFCVNATIYVVWKSEGDGSATAPGCKGKGTFGEW